MFVVSPNATVLSDAFFEATSTGVFVDDDELDLGLTAVHN